MKANNEVITFYKFFCKFISLNRIQLKIRPFHKEVCDTLQGVFTGKINKKIVIINISPRVGKTKLMEAFTCWCYAYFPDCHFIYASYSSDLATASTRYVLDTLQKEWYVATFGDKLGEVRKADYFHTKAGGAMKGDGTGGTLTGFGAGLKRKCGGCFSGETIVKTLNGEKRIDSILKNDYVLSYNHEKNVFEYKKVMATQELFKNEIITVITKKGKVIKCTADHNFYDGKSYKRIDSFAIGDAVFERKGKLLFKMRELLEGFCSWPRRNKKINNKGTDSCFLLGCMLLGKHKNREKIKKTKRYPMSCLQKNIQTSFSSCKTMLNGLQKSFLFAKNEGFGKLELQKQKKLATNTLQENDTANNRKRWVNLFLLWSFLESVLPPYRQEKEKQHSRKLDNHLCKLPFKTSPLSRDTISSFERTSVKEYPVYDIQVEGNNNFFAEGVLVHNCLICDDLQKPNEALSKAVTAEVQSWLTRTMISRLNGPQTPVIICAQRISEEDACGYVLKNYPDDVIHLKYPAMIDGVSTIEDTKSTEDLNALERIDPFTFYSQYQQEPIILGGNLIKTDWFRYFDGEIEYDYKFFTADTAMKVKEHNDFSVISCWGVVDGKIYLEDMVRGKFEAHVLEKVAIEFYNKHSPRFVLIEDKASGVGLIQTLRNLGFPIIDVQRTTDKLTRVMETIPFLAVGVVHIRKDAEYTITFLSECAGFRADMGHKHDDQVDTLCDAVNHVCRKKVSIFDAL